VGELRRDAVGRMDPFAEASLVGVLGGLDTPWQWFMEKAISNVGWHFWVPYGSLVLQKLMLGCWLKNVGAVPEKLVFYLK